MTGTLQLALIGENIAYSRSPGIFEAIFRRAGVAGSFVLHSVSAGELGECVRRLTAEGVLGFSVTIPHKQAIIASLDSIDHVVRVIEAVNAVKIEAGRLVGYNTDCHGFSFALHRFGYQAQAASALILGNGGAARAAIYALHTDFGIRRFILVGRSPEKVQALEQTLVRRLPTLEIVPYTEDANLPALDIAVNCTPLGGANHADENPFPGPVARTGVRLYYDLNYNTGNRALERARSEGIDVLDGSAMLVAQAVRSYELWTGRTAAFEPIYREIFGDR